MEPLPHKSSQGAFFLLQLFVGEPLRWLSMSAEGGVLLRLWWAGVWLLLTWLTCALLSCLGSNWMQHLVMGCLWVPPIL